MKKIIIIIMLVLVISGCISTTSEEPNPKDNTARYNRQLTIYTYCDDSVVCYYRKSGDSGGMDCFRDEDLVSKYC